MALFGTCELEEYMLQCPGYLYPRSPAHHNNFWKVPFGTWIRNGLCQFVLMELKGDNSEMEWIPDHEDDIEHKLMKERRSVTGDGFLGRAVGAVERFLFTGGRKQEKEKEERHEKSSKRTASTTSDARQKRSDVWHGSQDRETAQMLHLKIRTKKWTDFWPSGQSKE